MTTRYLEYPLADGYIHNWLVAGPQMKAVSGAFAFAPHLALPDEAIDRTAARLDDAELTWKYKRCLEDHLVDVSQFSPLAQSGLAYASTQLMSGAGGAVRLTFTAFGPAELWVNGERLAALKGAQQPWQPDSASVDVTLKAETQVLVRFAQQGQGALALAFALRVDNAPDDLIVRVATQARYPRRHYMFEKAFDLAYLENVTNHRGATFNMRFSEGIGEELTFSYQVQDKDAMIYVEGSGLVDPEMVNDVGHTVRLNERPYWVTLRAPGKEYYEQGLRYEVRLPIYVVDNDYSVAAGSNFSFRRNEALTLAAKRDGQVFAELARIALERWDEVQEGSLQTALARVKSQALDVSMDLIGLVSIACRYPNDDHFSDALKAGLVDGLLKYPYQHAIERAGQSEAFLLLTTQLLAGQLFADRPFADGINGQQHCAQANDAVMAAMHAAGQTGLVEWDSPVAFERFVVALSHLVTLAEAEALRDMAAVLLDKLIFLLASNAYRGGLSGTHGVSLTSDLRSTQLQATSGIMRLLWGAGACNRHIAGPVSIAMADYEFPSFIAEIASDPAEMLSREQHTGDGQTVNKVVYRTPDFLLASAQDYRPGQPGARELVWQAVLGPNAVVFTTAPANFGSDDAHQPGFWLGNAALPRVAQCKDALIAVYNLPQEAWLGFTHAYFPVHEMDEVVFENGWAFGQKGDGYVALAASSGFEQVGRIPDGQRELRAAGRRTTWICQMGRAESDGSFAEFCQRVQALPLAWGEVGAAFTTLRGDALSFGWQGALTVNGQPQALDGFAHIDNPFCQVDLPARQMDIAYGGIVMQLNFE